MGALNWQRLIREGKEKIEKVPEEVLKWEDIVTGTKYFLKLDEYNDIVSNLYNKINNLNYNEMIKVIDDDKNIKFIPWKESKASFIDAMRLYVLFACMFDGADKSKREEIYIDFILEKYRFENSYKIVKYIIGKNISKEDRDLLKEFNVTLIKGGAFKVKNYFLENNKLKDMRGASTLLTYVTEIKIPEIINNNFINEALIYSGGGNVMCIVSDEKIAKDLCAQFEKSFNKYTLTVENAFSYYESNLYDFIVNYKEEMRKLEARIENRKKLKIYNNVIPKSQLNNQKESININGKSILIKSEELKDTEEICYLCSNKKASYSVKLNGQMKNVCGSCLHKRIVGDHGKLGYNNKLKKYIKERYKLEDENQCEVTPVDTIDEIDPENKKIAVIYGDGNNIGSIVQNISNICEMMYFSRKIQNAANGAVYEAILKNSTDEKSIFKFEIIAIGGDDIFFIVPACKALYVAKDLIERFNEQFKNKTEYEYRNNHNATMSIGIAISSSKNDIRKLVEVAQNELKIAKNKERQLLLKHKNSGSISISFIKGSNYLSKESIKDKNKGIKQSMLPMSNDTFKGFLKLVLKLKSKDNNVNSSMLSRIEEASKKMDISEFMLFYLYNEAKKEKIMSNIFEYNKISLYEFEKGTFIEKISAEEENKKIYFPWSDILNFWKYV
ncbi:Cas10/Cmr2 second palm domain-containing protein [Clostridium sporogenes]|uniref:Cas10/Cmr2 second palm domain-containing protein n=1 Tax=Clostridium sporogenes TaxID=1509 RepID=UPI003DA24A7B